MVIVGAFPQPSRPREPRTGAAVPTLVDRRLCALFEANRRYLRRRRQRRHLQTALATSSLLLPVAWLSCQDLFTPTVLVLALGAWAALIGLTHVSLMSEWLCYLRTLRGAHDVCDRPSP
jgi:hypothetical protein